MLASRFLGFVLTLFPPPSDLSCSAFSSHIPPLGCSCRHQSSPPLGLVPSSVPPLGGCLGIQPLLCLVGKDLASPSPVTGRVWSALGEFPVSLCHFRGQMGQLLGGASASPFTETALVKPNVVFWGQVAEVLLLTEGVRVPADRSVISRALCLEFPL